MRLRLTFTRKMFDLAQDPTLDSDPQKLSYGELRGFLEKYSIYQVYRNNMPQCLRDNIKGQPSSWLDRRKRVHIKDGGKAEMKEADARKAIRQGLVVAMRLHWPTIRAKIQADIKAGNLGNVVPGIYLAIGKLSEAAFNDNPYLESICELNVRNRDLYQLEEITSPALMKHPVVKRFWQEMAKLMDAMMDGAKRKGVTDIRSLLGSTWEADALYSHDVGELSNPRKYEDSCRGDISLKELLQIAAPAVADRIQKWR